MKNTDSYLGNPNLKKIGVSIEFTPEQIKEYIKCSKDVMYFCEKFYQIVTVDNGIQPFIPYDYQREIIENSVNNRFSIHKIPRQAGKTTAIAALLTWYVLFNPNFSIAVLANKLKQSMEILSRIQLAYELLPQWLQQGIVTWNHGDIALENGSKIIASATTGSSIRGQTHNIIYLDEFAFVPNNMQEDFFTSTYPTITSGKTTKMIMTSTPNGLNMFYKLWIDSEQGRNNFVRTEIHWSDTPGRDEEWKKEQIKNIGALKFQQEYETEFLGSSLTLIAGIKLRQLAFINPLLPFDAHLSMFKKPIKGHTYVMTVDTATGVEQDASAFVIFDITDMPYEIVCVYRCDSIPVIIFPQIIANLGKSYNNAYALVELNANLGTQVVQLLHDDFEYDNIVLTTNHGRSGKRVCSGFGDVKQEFGICTTKSTKRDGCSNLKIMVENDQLIVNDIHVIFELGRFVQDKKKSYSADSGAHDDLSMCLVLFAWLATQPFIREINNIDFRRKLQKEKDAYVDQDLSPIGIFTSYEDRDEPVITHGMEHRKTFEQLLWSEDEEQW